MFFSIVNGGKSLARFFLMGINSIHGHELFIFLFLMPMTENVADNEFLLFIFNGTFMLASNL